MTVEINMMAALRKIHAMQEKAGDEGRLTDDAKQKRKVFIATFRAKANHNHGEAARNDSGNPMQMGLAPQPEHFKHRKGGKP